MIGATHKCSVEKTYCMHNEPRNKVCVTRKSAQGDAGSRKGWVKRTGVVSGLNMRAIMAK